MSEPAPATMRLPLRRRCVWEAVGTFALIYVGCGAMLSTDDAAAIALGFGLVVGLVVMTIGPRSGAHINPAVTIAFAAARRFPWSEAVPYIAAQLVGAWLGVASLAACFADIQPELMDAIDADIRSQVVDSTVEGYLRQIGQRTGTFPVHARPLDVGMYDPPVFLGTPWFPAAVAEFVNTALLMGVILCIVTDAKEEGGKCALVIGATIAALCAAGGASQASMNPARTIWCNLLAGRADTVALYLLAPIAGAVAAALVCNRLEPTPAEPSPLADRLGESD